MPWLFLGAVCLPRRIKSSLGRPIVGARGYCGFGGKLNGLREDGAGVEVGDRVDGDRAV